MTYNHLMLLLLANSCILQAGEKKSISAHDRAQLDLADAVQRLTAQLRALGRLGTEGKVKIIVGQAIATGPGSVAQAGSTIAHGPDLTREEAERRMEESRQEIARSEQRIHAARVAAVQLMTSPQPVPFQPARHAVLGASAAPAAAATLVAAGPSRVIIDIQKQTPNEPVGSEMEEILRAIQEGARSFNNTEMGEGYCLVGNVRIEGSIQRAIGNSNAQVDCGGGKVTVDCSGAIKNVAIQINNVEEINVIAVPRPGVTVTINGQKITFADQK